MTTDEHIAFVGELASETLTLAAETELYAGPDPVRVDQAQRFREEAATLTSVQNALIRLREIERAHGGEA